VHITSHVHTLACNTHNCCIKQTTSSSSQNRHRVWRPCTVKPIGIHWPDKLASPPRAELAEEYVAVLRVSIESWARAPSRPRNVMPFLLDHPHTRTCTLPPRTIATWHVPPDTCRRSLTRMPSPVGVALPSKRLLSRQSLMESQPLHVTGDHTRHIHAAYVQV
jgi:hypothetical protein